MALLSRKPPAPEPTIVPLMDNPEHQRLAGLRRALSAGLADRQRALDLAAIETELQHSGGSSRGPRADQMRARAEQLRKALPTPIEPPASPDGLSAAIVAALALLDGGKLAAPTDRGARLTRLREEIAVIEPALAAVNAMMTELKGELTFDAATALLPRHRAALADMFAAAAAFSAATQAERQIVVDLLGAGYDAAEHVLLRPGLGAASRLGTLSEHDSEISIFRRRLEGLGIIQ
jgi:hypothetical protein